MENMWSKTFEKYDTTYVEIFICVAYVDYTRCVITGDNSVDS